MNSALDDIIVVLEWLAATKTPTNKVAEALDRLKKRGHIPADVKTENFADRGRQPDDDFGGG
jgi:hypothetical protein